MLGQATSWFVAIQNCEIAAVVLYKPNLIREKRCQFIFLPHSQHPAYGSQFRAVSDRRE